MSPITMSMKDHRKVVSHLESAIKEYKVSKQKRVLAGLVEVSSHRFSDYRVIYDRKGNKVLVETKTL